MMHSTYGGGEDDEDVFAPNPFRSSSNNNNADLLGTPNPQQQQQPMMMPPQQPMMMPPPQQQVMMQPPNNHIMNQPDPNSGMTGHFTLPPPTPTQQANPVQFLSGTMDQKATIASNNNNNNYGGTSNNNNNAGGGGLFARCTSCCRLETYQSYFDMDTIDIQQRIEAALLHFYRPDYFRVHVVGTDAATDDPNTVSSSQEMDTSPDTPLNRKGPDLYGPFWISMTLVFLLGVTSNLFAYYHYQASHPRKQAAPNDSNSTDTNYESEDVQEFENDLTHMVRALTVVTIFAWVVPTIFWLTTSCLGMSNNNNSSLSWIWWVCCYGYSLVPFCLVTTVAWIPVVTWIVLGIAAVMSGLLLLRNLSNPLLSADAAKAAPLILAIPATHFVLVCVLKLTFYAA